MALYPYWLGQVPKDWDWCNNVSVTETETSIPKEKISLTDTGYGDNHLEQLKDEIDNPTSSFPEGDVVGEIPVITLSCAALRTLPSTRNWLSTSFEKVSNPHLKIQDVWVPTSLVEGNFDYME